ncbi:MAG: phosphate/phosphite/phosphonate ABC transporter substrate-binding protein [Elusimicrobia bacterium]|nr:phosphate/phosphite/phosphonate ABC transporter substrate-binding protein [Elusimicrobiota bacterium]
MTVFRRRPIAVLALACLAAACGPREPVPTVRLSQAAPARAAAPEQPVLRVAVAAFASPRKNLADYDAILWHLGRKLGRPVEIVQRETYAESIELLERRQVDSVFMCSGPYVEARRRFGAEILAVPRIGGKTTYRAYVIVPVDSPDRSLDDLRGKSFAFTDPLSTTGRLYVAFLLAERGLVPERFFGRTMFTKGHDNSIKAVADGLVDGASVDQLIWDDLARAEPAVASRTRIILRSPPFGMSPVVVHPAMDAGLKAGMRAVLSSMHLDQEGRALLAKPGIERFVPQDDSAYDGIRRMQERVALEEASPGREAGSPR